MLGKILDLTVALIGGYSVTVILLPILLKQAIQFGFIVHPHDRGIHREKMPIAGGLSFGLSFLCFIAYYYVRHYDFDMSYQVIVLFGGTIAILLLGLLDDHKDLKAMHKLIGLIFISSVMYFAGFKIERFTNPLGGIIQLGGFSYSITLGWYLVLMNAFNLIDGMDGLAAGIGAIVSLVLAISGIRFHNPYVVFMGFTLFASLIAFLKYNFYPAKIFMGDTGSLVIGFIIASISIIGMAGLKGIAAMTLLIPIASMFIPLLDVALSIFRRVRKRKNIFKADKEHLHHKMLALGHSQRFVALIAYFITFLFGMISLGFSFAEKHIFFITLSCLTIFTIAIFLLLIKKDFHK